MAIRIDYAGKWLSMTVSQRPARATIRYSDKRKPLAIIKWTKHLDYGLFLAREIHEYLGPVVTFFDYTTVILQVAIGDDAVISPIDVRLSDVAERYGEAIQRGIEFLTAPDIHLVKREGV